MLRRRLDDDRGVGLVMALAISFIIFSLGAVWIVTSNHELDETLFYRHRSGALNTAEAGVRWTMSALAQDTEAGGWIGVDETTGVATDISLVGVRTALETSDYVASGTSGGSLGDACSMTAHLLSAAGEQTGEWWVRVWPIDLDEFVYQIESWGWSPTTDHRQTAAQKLVVQVRLVPEYDGFTNAIFAEGRLSGLNRKEIYGDVYSGETANISNYTRIHPNDAGYFGEGRLRIYGDLLLATGSNNQFGGPVHVQGIVRDDNLNTEYAEVLVRNDEAAEPATGYGGQSWFRDGIVIGEAKFDKKWSTTYPGYTGTITGEVVDGVNDLPPVPKVGLPDFTWDPSDYAPPLVTFDHPSVAAFTTWFTANKAALYGVHHVPGPVNLDFRAGGIKMAEDFMVVADGDVLIQGTPSVLPTAETPVHMVVVQTTETGRLTTSNSVISVDGVLHHLLFSAGEYDAANQTTLYGSVYGEEDVSTNRLEVHFRPPPDTLVAGFDFYVPDAVFFLPEPQIWRAVAANEPTPISDYCAVP